MTRVFIAVYLVEAGLILMAAPWTDWWRFNYFADVMPWIRQVMATQGMRALVVGVGLLTVVVGLADLWTALAARLGRRPTGSDVADS
ncbi:MAG: hypothetical protein ABS36_06735 [Acidobacteria bacterium SCN 69-37]|nr:MAG: hypothetical protein ABS36_06735 [Acidobacteria bacterium SCN 69-37]